MTRRLVSMILSVVFVLTICVLFAGCWEKKDSNDGKIDAPIKFIDRVNNEPTGREYVLTSEENIVYDTWKYDGRVHRFLVVALIDGLEVEFREEFELLPQYSYESPDIEPLNSLDDPHGVRDRGKHCVTVRIPDYHSTLQTAKYQLIITVE